jgi:hypothetical protein
VVSEVGADRQHVGPVDEIAVLDTGHPEDEADDVAAAVEGAGGDATDALADLEDSCRDPLAETGAPDPVLEVDAGNELIVRGKVSNVDLRSCGGRIVAVVCSAAGRVTGGRHIGSAL